MEKKMMSKFIPGDCVTIACGSRAWVIDPKGYALYWHSSGTAHQLRVRDDVELNGHTTDLASGNKWMRDGVLPDPHGITSTT